MPVLLSVFGLVWLIAFLAAPAMGAGWSWDAGNALGFAAFAGMLYLTIPGDSRRDVRTHELLGYAVLFVALVHALWFLLVDGVAVEFVKPGAPLYMWAGIVGIVLLAVLVFLAMLPTRLRAHRSYATFRYWHLVVSILAMAMTAYHIVFSGFYLRTWYQVAAFVVLAVTIIFARTLGIDRGRFPVVSPNAFLVVTAAATLLFAAIRNIAP